MKLTSRAVVHATLTTGLLLVVASLSSSARADHNPGAHPIAHGHGEYVGGNQEDKSLTFSVVELPDGSVQGSGMLIEHVSLSFVHFELSSFMFVGDSLGVAGEITMAVNAPPQLAVGTTIFFFFNDNDPDADEVGQGLVPPAFGNPSIQQIVEILLMGDPPPPEVFTPLFSGNIRIF